METIGRRASLHFSREDPISFKWRTMSTKEFYRVYRINTSVHGAHDVLSSTRSDFCFLFGVFVSIALTFALVGSYMILQDYLSKSVIVSYFVTETDKLLRPQMIVCPLNRLSRTFIEHHNISFELAQYVELSYSVTFQTENQDRLLQPVTNNLNSLHSQLEDLLASMGGISYELFLEQALLPCEAFLSIGTCYNQSAYTNTLFGRCLRVNSTEQTGNGIAYAEQLIINIPSDLFTVSANQWWADGIALKLAHTGQGMDTEFVLIPPGKHTAIALKATKYEFMNDPPFHTCVNRDETYNRIECYERCLTSSTERECGCSPMFLQYPSTDTVCTGRQVLECFNRRYKYDKASIRRCKDKCPRPCHFWTYKKTISSTDRPAMHLRQFVPKDILDSTENKIIVDLFYVALEHTTIRHVINMPIWHLIAQIGGHVSLFVGASLASVVQVAVYSTYVSGYSLSDTFRNLLLRVRLVYNGIFERRQPSRQSSNGSVTLELGTTGDNCVQDSSLSAKPAPEHELSSSHKNDVLSSSS